MISDDENEGQEPAAAPAAEAKPKRARKAKAEGKAAKGGAKAKKAAPKRAAAKSGGSKSVIDQSKYDYEVSDVKTASGRKSVSNGDRVAQALRGLDAKSVLAALKDNGLKPNPSWDGLNPGMVRMNVGNMLRRLVRNNQSVKSGGKSIASL